MKKVLFTATVDSHINQFHLPYLKLFKDNGYEVHVATNTDEPIEYCDVKHKISFERSPFKINNLKAIRHLKNIIDEEKFDIIHTHTPMGSVVTRIAAINTRKENNTKVIYTAHGFHFYKGAPILNWLLFYPVEKYLSKYTDVLITINKEDYEIAKKKMKSKQIEYVPGVGVDSGKFNFKITKEEKNQLRESLRLSEKDFVLIYTAELNKNKNQIMLIQAMKKVVKNNANIHLILVGKGNLKEYYEKKINEYNLYKNVHLLGYRTDVPNLLKISNLAISTSLREGLGLNVIEANISGIPAIVTDNRGHRDIIINGINGNLIDLKNIKELIESILEIRRNKELYDQMVIKSKELSINFDLGNVLETFQKIYFA
jgi:glycosyltransferase EpsD